MQGKRNKEEREGQLAHFLDSKSKPRKVETESDIIDTAKMYGHVYADVD
jgi:hypothetical protein